MSILAPEKKLFWLFVRAYAVYQGKTIYGETVKIGLKQLPTVPIISVNMPFVYTLNKIDLVALGWSGIKFFTIGSCIDDGILTLWCAFDVVTTGALVISIINPYDFGLPDAIAVETKLGKIAQTAEILKGIKTGTQFGNMIKSLTIIYKDRKFVVEGLKLSGLLDKGIIKIESGAIKAAYPQLFRYALEKGDYSIMNLIGKGASKELLESAVKYGADLSKMRFVTKNAKTIAWLEEGVGGASGWGWAHIDEGFGLQNHVNQIADALKIKPSEVQGVIKTTIETYTRSPPQIINNAYEFYKEYKVGTKTVTIKAVVSNANIGRIVTAFVDSIK